MWWIISSSVLTILSLNIEDILISKFKVDLLSSQVLVYSLKKLFFIEKLVLIFRLKENLLKFTSITSISFPLSNNVSREHNIIKNSLMHCSKCSWSWSLLGLMDFPVSRLDFSWCSKDDWLGKMLFKLWNQLLMNSLHNAETGMWYIDEKSGHTGAVLQANILSHNFLNKEVF